MATYEGHLQAPTKGRFAIVASRFNALVVDRLLAGALDAFRKQGVNDDRLDIVWVPGSLEMPIIAKQLAASGRYLAVVCLSCILRGETDHYEYVASQTAAGILQTALATGVPVIFGVLTCDTLEQALHRAGGKSGNKGSDAALTALEMANLLNRLSTISEHGSP
ncbi:MAG: 6,7-dimethyl-8-ribityllumazine synthase [Gemmatales bacterium]|nr:6,7-dimethyl-8-ribityllumazine synthase [Gemmatales bacterium]MCS7161571.1 6,7-dimethyl-8-ribityllumazine synthase [Gemmatales bacterium]MDW8176774.1 6,7-dimethyl-8-ribityllumazine synthase [Gemmatales bacterium]MDW8221479.1 6,7-dimethyl-8-ribityllumazine synthase [Gemmatales bacterium]